MATLRTLRPTILRPQRLLPTHRTFLTNPLALLSALNPTTTTQSPPQTLTACRTLPYPSAPVYSIIADIASYDSFLPYLQSSRVTRWSAPDALVRRRWPSEATLVVGFGGVSEAFASRVFCVPGRVVESVAGGAVVGVKREDVRHHYGEGEAEAEAEAEAHAKAGHEGGAELLTHLRSRWTVEAMEDGKTQVSLAVEFAFQNPVYTALSASAAPKVADYMIAAFEKRVEQVLEANPEMKRMGLGELEGSALRK